MNAILMTHPLHGATHAYDHGDIRRLQGYGWTIAEVKAPEPVVEPVAVEEAEVKRKPGRPKGK